MMLQLTPGQDETLHFGGYSRARRQAATSAEDWPQKAAARNAAWQCCCGDPLGGEGVVVQGGRRKGRGVGGGWGEGTHK